MAGDQVCRAKGLVVASDAGYVGHAEGSRGHAPWPVRSTTLVPVL